MSAYEDLSPAEASKRLAGFTVVDVRGESEFDGPLGRVPGSKHVPLGELEARAVELSDATPLLLVCRSGRRSGFACDKLLEAGIGPVANLDGGMIAWNRDGLSVERTPVDGPADVVAQLATWLGQVTPLGPEGAGAAVRGACADAGSRFEAPSPAAARAALDRVDALAREHGDPADRPLVIDALRRALEGL